MGRRPAHCGLTTQYVFSKVEVEQATFNTPRFLFRTWRIGALDNRTTDTDDSIIPSRIEELQYMDPHKPHTITEIPKARIIEAAKYHLNNEYEATSYFSSWTHSWRQLSSYVEMHMANSAKSQMEDVYIAIIDTTRLPAANAVLHSSFFSKHDDAIPEAPEYLIYGAISDHAFCPVSLKEIFQSCALEHIFVGPWPYWIVLEEAIAGARLFASCFTAYFQLPVIANLLSSSADSNGNGFLSHGSRSLGQVISMLGDYKIPKDWCQDPYGNQHGTPDSNRASNLLRALVERIWGEERDADDIETPLDTTTSEMAQLSLTDADSSPYCCSSVPKAKVWMVDDIENDQDIYRPPGVLDADSQESVLVMQRDPPRYLFRGWCNQDRTPSGGDPGLNTLDAVTPWAFYFDIVPKCQTVNDLTRSALGSCAWSHLRFRKQPPTIFSSWTASLDIAIQFAQRLGQHETCSNCHISIVDTTMLRHRNAFLWVTHFDWLDGSKGWHRYPWEYLAHGIIEGPAHKAVPLESFYQAGLQKNGRFSAKNPGLMIQGTIEEELRSAISIAMMYGEDFVVPMTLAILSCKDMDRKMYEYNFERAMSIVAKALETYEIPREVCRNIAVTTDVVESVKYQDVDLMKKMLRYMLERHRRVIQEPWRDSLH